jgi:cyclophilin family peptidyl-prolyl cis-trans isomerase
MSAKDQALADGLYAEITTPKGVITCDLAFETTPLTVANFVGLAEGALGPVPRKPFFDGLKFHRVVPGFVIQGGDPLGTGEGGPGYSFPDEFSPGLSHGSAGVLSMANDGPDTNGSQFFITLAPVERLDYLYAVFGHVVRGMDVLAKVAQGDGMQVRIIRQGKAAASFRADQAAFDALSAKTLRYAAEKEPGPKALFDDPDKVLPTDPPRAKNFNYKLANVQRSSGVRLLCRILARAPADTAAELQEYTSRLAATLGADTGVLAVYFADKGTWKFSFGGKLADAFVDSELPAGSRGKPDALARATALFVEQSDGLAREYAAQSKTILPNILQTPGMQVKISVDAILDELIKKLIQRKGLT